MESYCYPDVLYCIKCDADVTADILEQHETIQGNDGEPVVIDFKIAVCPECRSELCRRDYYSAFAKAVKEHSMNDGGDHE